MHARRLHPCLCVDHNGGKEVFNGCKSVADGFIYAMIKPSLHDEGMMFFNKFCALTLHFKRMSLWLVKENLVETELIFYG